MASRPSASDCLGVDVLRLDVHNAGDLKAIDKRKLPKLDWIFENERGKNRSCLQLREV